MAIKKVALAVIVIQDGRVSAKAIVNSDQGTFDSTFSFDLDQCPEIGNAALALDHDVRTAVHETLGIEPPAFKPLPSKILQPN